MAARKNRTCITEEWRKRISTGKILDRLNKHVEGKVEMKSTQVRAADILLKKVIPDLSHSETDHRGAVAVGQLNLSPEQQKSGIDAIMRYAAKHGGNNGT